MNEPTQSRSLDGAVAPERDISCSCKLPLLDGNVESATRSFKIDVELANIGKYQKAAQQDHPDHETVICTAWALLLRCYTGQDQVCFQIRRKDDRSSPEDGHLASEQDIFMLNFESQVALGTYLEQARETMNSQGSCITSSPLCNTVLWLGGDSSPDHDDTNTHMHDTKSSDPPDVSAC